MNVVDRHEFRRVVEWIEDISLEDWPQQHRIYGDQLRPAMVNDLAWHDFGSMTDPLVTLLMQAFAPIYKPTNRMLSVVMPRDGIYAHCDEQPEDWLIRVHVPLVTNPRATFKIDGHTMHMEYGIGYLVNTRLEHSIRNEGLTPRIHFMFDVVNA